MSQDSIKITTSTKYSTKNIRHVFGIFGIFGMLYSGKSTVGWEFKLQGCQRTNFNPPDWKGSSPELLNMDSAADWILPKLTWTKKCAKCKWNQFCIRVHQQNYRFMVYLCLIFFRIVVVDTETKAAC